VLPKQLTRFPEEFLLIQPTSFIHLLQHHQCLIVEKWFCTFPSMPMACWAMISSRDRDRQLFRPGYRIGY
ncbi:MAG: hypothetical protein WAU17_05820, partial [Nitrospirales bacterium]